FQFDPAWSDDLNSIAQQIERAALGRVGDGRELLALLRMLEQLHRDICDTYFRDALPENRQQLYALLRDIEVHGGWPYIQRMKLLALLAKFDLETQGDPMAGNADTGAGT
ncbi:hypothetical protein, partial [Haemophilus parainfluenzae]|uniref:hypothetical protein n=1 Tax=Haemophilus parainfluenzae TaxID=729 RepID=UPI00124B8B63